MNISSPSCRHNLVLRNVEIGCGCGLRVAVAANLFCLGRVGGGYRFYIGGGCAGGGGHLICFGYSGLVSLS